jgi:hypothetical protein
MLITAAQIHFGGSFPVPRAYASALHHRSGHPLGVRQTNGACPCVRCVPRAASCVAGCARRVVWRGGGVEGVGVGGGEWRVGGGGAGWGGG